LSRTYTSLILLELLFELLFFEFKEEKKNEKL